MIPHAATTRVASLLTAAAVAAALAAGASAGSPAQEDEIYVNPSTGFASTMPQTGPKVYVNPSTGFASGANASSSSSDEVTISQLPQPALAEPAQGGFDWPSAGIGAAAAGGLVLLLLAAVVGLGRRGRRPLARSGAART